MAENYTLTRDILGNLINEDFPDNSVTRDRRTDNSYSELLSYFESRYGGDTERLNYAEVILSMKSENQISNLVKIYNKVLKKLLLFCYHSEEFIPGHWFKGIINNKQWLWDDLKAFLNDQIKRIFDENPYSDKLAIECITNLRQGSNEESTRSYIASKSSEEVKAVLGDIVACKKIVLDAPNHMSQYNLETNEYRDYKPRYTKAIKSLLKNGYHKGYNDTCFELKVNVKYFPDTKSLVLFILAMIILIPVVILIIHYAFVGFFSVICILALLKMLKNG